MSLRKALPFLKADAPHAIFRKIVAHNDNANTEGEQVYVKLFLTDGHLVEAAPLHINDDNHAILVSKEGQLIYANISALRGLEIVNAALMINELTGQDFLDVAPEEVKSKLQLKRLFNDFGEDMQKSYGIRIAGTLLENGLDSDIKCYQFEKFLKLLETTLKSIASSDMGAQALADLGELRIEEASKPLAVRQEGAQVHLGVDLSRKFSSDLADSLQNKLEASL